MAERRAWAVAAVLVVVLASVLAWAMRGTAIPDRPTRASPPAGAPAIAVSGHAAGDVLPAAKREPVLPGAPSPAQAAAAPAAAVSSDAAGPPSAGADRYGRSWQRRDPDGSASGGFPAPDLGKPVAPVDLSWRWTRSGATWSLLVRLVPRGTGRELTCGVTAGGVFASAAPPVAVASPGMGRSWDGSFDGRVDGDAATGWIVIRYGLDGRSRVLRIWPAGDPDGPARPPVPGEIEVRAGGERMRLLPAGP